MKSVIDVKNLSKIFRIRNESSPTLFNHLKSVFSGLKRKHFTALESVSFSINKGDFVAIVGRNGSGKSTLLKLLLGIYPASEGKFSISGRMTGIIELGVGFKEELTARENIFLYGVLIGLDRKLIGDLMEDILEYAGLTGHENVQLKRFSSGMKSRLAFSVAKNANPDIFVIDEVFAVGDGSFQKKALTYFKEYKKKGNTLLLSTHNLVLARELCNKALYIDNGSLVAYGDCEDILKLYESTL